MTLLQNSVELEIQQLKLRKLEALEAETDIVDKLPHLYMHKQYKWAHEFENDLTTKTQIVCASNQIGKSSALIKKLIRIATEPECWPTMWPDLVPGMLPSQWWYLYPTNTVSMTEFKEKWEPLLPKFGREHPQYGFWVKQDKDGVESLHFNTGITIYFKHYSQNAQALQSGSVYIVSCDEEVSTALIPELQMRVKATKGYMFFVFTATMGQQFWKDAVENRTIWPEARVWQVSMRACKYYTDGTPSQWTDEAVDQVIRDCISPEEVQRRVHGKIIGANDVGRQFPTFARIMHMRPYLPIPKDYMLYAGVDYGSGTQPKGHPSAITVIAVNIARTRGRVVRFWRGDDMQTTCGDVIDMYEEMTRGLTMQTAFYDFSARDLGTIATRRGLPFQQADKRRESGKSFINTLFKNGALHLDEMNDAAELDNILPTQLETWKLADELENLQEIVRKTSAKDDGIDSLRYAVHGIAWDWDSMRGTRPQGIGNTKRVVEEVSERQLKTRWDGIPPVEDRDSSIIEEFDFWEQQLDVYT